MNFPKMVTDDYRTLRDGNPGDRFRSYVDKRRERRGGQFSFSRIFSFAVGLVFIVVGFGIGWLPGPGGFVAIIGLALIAQEIPIIADVLDRFELLSRKIFGAVKNFFRRNRPSRTIQRVNSRPSTDYAVDTSDSSAESH